MDKFQTSNHYTVARKCLELDSDSLLQDYCEFLRYICIDAVPINAKKLENSDTHLLKFFFVTLSQNKPI